MKVLRVNEETHKCLKTEAVKRGLTMTEAATFFIEQGIRRVNENTYNVNKVS